MAYSFLFGSDWIITMTTIIAVLDVTLTFCVVISHQHEKCLFDSNGELVAIRFDQLYFVRGNR